MNVTSRPRTRPSTEEREPESAIYTVRDYRASRVRAGEYPYSTEHGATAQQPETGIAEQALYYYYLAACVCSAATANQSMGHFECLDTIWQAYAFQMP